MPQATFKFAGHNIRARERSKRCGPGCRGCPHVSVVVEVTFPSGRRRELWCEPPADAGVAAGPPRTRRVVVPDRGELAERDGDSEHARIHRVDW